MFLVADSAVSLWILDDVKIMLNANFIGTLSDELQGFHITVPTNPVKVIRTNGDVIMNVIGINVSADDYRSILSENSFCPLNTDAMCRFCRNA